MQLIDHIVTVSQNFGWKIDNHDVEELLNEHQAEVTTEELIHLHDGQKKSLEEECLLRRMREGKLLQLWLSKNVCQIKQTSEL